MLNWLLGDYHLKREYTMIIEQAKEVLKIEAQGILDLVDKIGPEFEQAVDLIIKSKGRVIMTGIGKSGLVARKISATLSSTGTPSLFLHPAEAIHGDLGMVTGDDIIIALSYTGQTSEINHILPMLRSMGAKIIALTGHMDSPMTMSSDIVIDVGVEREACPMGLAPTTSTTATLAMGDALAVALINRRRFDRQDFKRIHPGGGLGERLATKVREVMLTEEHIPRTYLGSKVREAILEIEVKGIGATIIVDREEKLAGIITDGDLRRQLLKMDNIHELQVDEVMSPSPKTVDEDEKVAEALALMEYYAITHLLVLDREKRVKGVLHLHDLLGREDFKLNGRTIPAQRSDC